MSMGNRSFFCQRKILKYCGIAVIGICVDFIHTTKLRRFRFPNIINATFIKKEIVTNVPIAIQTFFQNSMKCNTSLKDKISSLKPSDLNSWYEKAARYIDVFHIGCNFYKVRLELFDSSSSCRSR